MQIDWKYGTGTNEKVILCNGPERGVGLSIGPADFQASEQVSTQVVPRLRAAKAGLYDRGNMLHLVSFQVTKTYETQVQAFTEFHTWRDALPRSGTLILRYLPGSRRVEYQEALLEIASRRRIGVAIIWGYQITARTIASY